MFERYTEAARRALFFARFESSQHGSLAITPEHLLLGILREPGAVVPRMLPDPTVTAEAVRDWLAKQITQEPYATSIEIPFSPATKRVLQCAAEEADRLLDAHIGPEHLLLALLREPDSAAASLLRDRGLQLDALRQQIGGLTSVQRDHEADVATFKGKDRVERAERQAALDAYVALIKQRVTQLAELDDAASRQTLAGEIHTALDTLHDRL